MTKEYLAIRDRVYNEKYFQESLSGMHFVNDMHDSLFNIHKIVRMLALAISKGSKENLSFIFDDNCIELTVNASNDTIQWIEKNVIKYGFVIYANLKTEQLVKLLSFSDSHITLSIINNGFRDDGYDYTAYNSIYKLGFNILSHACFELYKFLKGMQ